ncbi:MAG TPA: hypothetical protein VHC90_14170 [Bryobacteraceae bacterium]|nr:hypothetical protein [Bryobacteraceae bacterium]
MLRGSEPSATPRRILILLALAIIAYLPSLNIPFIVDDYGQIPLARTFAAQGWTPLFANHELRARATYMFLSAALDRAFGFSPLIFHAASIVLHALCVLLVYATAIWIEIGEPTAFFAAAFFAIQEGHQEAIVWPAAAADLFVFLFGMAAWLCWLQWLRSKSWKWYIAAIVTFLLAIASKESAWIFPALMLLPIAFDRTHRRFSVFAALTPFLALSAAYIFWTWSTRITAPGFHDTRFALSAPWLLILLNSWWRLLFVWGLIALAVLLWLRKRAGWRLIAISSIWIAATLFPYCFLTYQMQVPSRLTYTATAGLAWLIGAAAVRLRDTNRQTLFAVLCIATLAINLEILWVKKMSQFRERALPSELMKDAGLHSDGTVRISCDPLPNFIAVDVLQSVNTKTAFEPGEREDQSCFAVDYRTPAGQLIHESRRILPVKHGTFY